MAAARVQQNREAQVQTCLATVMDPELDESVIELGFVTAVVIRRDGEVHITFRLPTYWCAANFAFLMADDMRLAVQVLPWVAGVRVELQDHMYADAINGGVAAGDGFRAAFGAQAEGGLEALRRTFLVKAFLRRQEALLEHLLIAGHAPAMLLALDVDALQTLTLRGDGVRLLDRYLERRGVVGNGARAFVDSAENAIDPARLDAHRRLLRSVGVNAEFNGSLCRGLLAVRDAAPEPQTLHFVPRVAPPRPGAPNPPSTAS